MSVTKTAAFSPPVLQELHYFSACGNSVEWNSQWYTAPFFTASSAFYDSVASTGQVEPPTSVVLTESACRALQSSLSLQSISSKASISSALVMSASDSSSSASVTRATLTWSASSASRPSSGASMTTTSSAMVTSSAPLVPVATPSAVDAVPGQPSSDSTCAGNWDPQAKSATAAAVWSTLVGAAVWLAFAVVRGRATTFYEARRWFIPAENRPLPVHASLLSFIFPPIPLLPPLSSPGTTDVHMHIHTLFTSLRIVGLWTAVSLVTALPLYTVGMPCLAVVRGRSAWGGGTGSLTDLSLLRLLDALDPAALVPASTSSDATTSTLAVLSRRDRILTPPSDAYTRLLILTILLPLIAVLPAIVLVLRAFYHAVKFRDRFLRERCGGLEMIWLPSAREGLGEEGMRELLTETGLWQEAKDEAGPNIVEGAEVQDRKPDGQPKEPTVMVHSLAGVSDTTALDALVVRRFEALNTLEESEKVYIESFEVRRVNSHSEDDTSQEPLPTTSLRQSSPSGSPEQDVTSPPTGFLAPAQYYRVEARSASSSPLPSPVIPAYVRSKQSSKSSDVAPSKSRFREVERDSGFFGGRTGKLELGTRLEEDADRNLIAAVEEGVGDRSQSGMLAGGQAGPDGVLPPASGGSRSSLSSRPVPSISPSDASNNADSQRQPELRLAHDGDEAALAETYQTIVRSRADLKELNEAVEVAQARALEDVAVGRNLRGFVLIGQGMRHLHGALLIEGYSKEDIVWAALQQNVSRPARGIVGFWLAVSMIGVVLGAACLPFLALTVAPAPGVSRYVGVLRSVSARSDLGAALVFGLVPALAISLFIAVAVALIRRVASSVGIISITHRDRLVFQGVWLVVLVVSGGWLVACSSILFATSALNERTGESVDVADGSVYSSAYFLVFLIDLALIGPGLQLLQPRRLYRFLRAMRRSSTPRQRFRASRPTSFDPTFQEVICLVALFYSAAFSLIFPLLGIPAFFILLLSLVALRYLIYFVCVQSSGGQSGGQSTLWLLARFGYIISLTPLLYGLVLASRRLWSFAAAMLAVALFSFALIEITTRVIQRRPSRRDLSETTQAALQTLHQHLTAVNTVQNAAALPRSSTPARRDGLPATHRPRERRTSLASILVLLDRFLPASRAVRNKALPLPLKTEAVDDMISTELAAATHPQAPPHLVDDPADALRPLCYPPNVVQPRPTIWLTEGRSRVGRREAIDLDHYHGLSAISTVY